MSLLSVNIIVACAVSTRVIGIDGKMPWHLPADLKYFKARTEGEIVIMGRNTFESIGKGLPNRINIVITNNDEFKAKLARSTEPTNSSVWLASSYKEALRIALTFKEKETFVIGGGQLYKEAIKGFVKYLYVTWVNEKSGNLIEGDTVFPDIDLGLYKLIDIYDESSDDKYTLTFTTYEPKKNGNTKTDSK